VPCKPRPPLAAPATSPAQVIAVTSASDPAAMTTLAASVTVEPVMYAWTAGVRLLTAAETPKATAPPNRSLAREMAIDAAPPSAWTVDVSSAFSVRFVSCCTSVRST